MLATRPVVAILMGASALAGASESASSVAIVHSTEWNPGDHIRDAAGEFSIYLRAAQLQRAHPAVGLVAVGDRHGMLRSGGERALRRLVVSGVVVAKLAPDGEVAPADSDLFLDGSGVAPDQLAGILARCLERHGSPPIAADPAQPTAAEKHAIREHLAPFFGAIAEARSTTAGRIVIAAAAR